MSKCKFIILDIRIMYVKKIKCNKIMIERDGGRKEYKVICKNDYIVQFLKTTDDCQISKTK